MKRTVDPATGLTSRQTSVLTTLLRIMRREGRVPTLRELTLESIQGYSNACQQVLQALEKKGYVKLAAGRGARGIQVHGVRFAMQIDDTPEGERLKAIID